MLRLGELRWKINEKKGNFSNWLLIKMYGITLAFRRKAHLQNVRVMRFAKERMERGSPVDMEYLRGNVRQNLALAK